MSAFVIIKKRNQIDILSDGAHYHSDGVITEISEKAFKIGATGVLTGRGDARAFKSVGQIVERLGLQFDRFLTCVPELEDCFEEGTVFELIIAGWSQTRQRIEVYFYSVNMQLSPMWPQRKLNLVSHPFVCSPCPNDATLLALGLPTLDRLKVEEFVPERDGILFMEALRRFPTPAAGQPGAAPVGHGTEAGLFSIGGLVTCSTVTRDGVNQRMIHEWPEDKVGSLITPKPISEIARKPIVVAPAATPADPGLTRQQRRQLEREQQKQKAVA